MRKDDRDFQVGDTVILMEYDPSEPIESNKYTGRKIMFDIHGILRDVPQFGLMDGYCILSFLYDIIDVYGPEK